MLNGVYGKICHREPWGMALVAGEFNGRGLCRSWRERLQVVFRDVDYVSGPRG